MNTDMAKYLTVSVRNRLNLFHWSFQHEIPWAENFFPYHHEIKPETPQLIPLAKLFKFHALLETLVLGFPSPLPTLLGSQGGLFLSFPSS